MGDITIKETDYERLMKSGAQARAEVRRLRDEAERAGVKAWKEGRRGEAVKLIGGANAPMFQALLGGAGLFFLGTSDLFNIKAFREHWYLKPMAVIGIGLWLWRRQSSWANVFLSAGAALFLQAWNEDQARKKREEEAKKAAAAPPTATAGVDEAGRFDWSDDTYGRGRWIETPTGAHAYMTEGAGAHAAERIAGRVFEHARAVA